MIDFGTQDDLLARVGSTLAADPGERPLAILCGSGLTTPSVPNVNGIIMTVRKSLSPDEVAELDERLADIPDGGQKYQAAFTFLSKRKSPKIRDRIIRICTLMAYKGPGRLETTFTPAELQKYESDSDGWNLPPGVAALGRIWAGIPDHRRGPVVTTNFDPLCEVAIRKAGRDAYPRMMDIDGSFIRDVRAVDIPQVVHIHGYWRESATLSMTSQLTLDRPALSNSVRSLLTNYTLLVIGYGGWDDAFTRQLSAVIREQSGHDLDVLWTSYSSPNTFAHELSTNVNLETLTNAPGNVQFYAGIDVNDFLPKLENNLGHILTFSDLQRIANGRGQLLGWEPVARRKELDDTTARRRALDFFAGRIPAWRDTSNEYIPRRDVVATVANQIDASATARRSSVTLILGPAGEGKTTALMQSAQLLRDRHGEWPIMFSPDGELGTVDQILALPTDMPHILVIDDAYRCVDRLRQLVSRLNEDGRDNIHIVTASRDSDWTSVGGYTFAWSKYLEARTHKLRGISRPDALSIVQAWERHGREALGALAQEPTTESRVTQLMNASSDPSGSAEGALLGALLVTRYGNGFREHVRELLLRLSDREVRTYGQTTAQSETLTLADVFYTIALPHSVGITTLSRGLLSDALGIAKHDLVGSALGLLAEEAAASYSHDYVSARHVKIAQVAVDLAPELNIRLDKVVKRLVHAAIRNIEVGGISDEMHAFAYMSAHLGDHRDLATVAAETALDAVPTRLSYRSTLSRVHREQDRVDAAVMVCAEAPDLLHLDDADTGLRPFLNEWGVAHGNAGHVNCNVLLSGLSLADSATTMALSDRQAAPAMSCLALALRTAWSQSGDVAFLRGLSAVLSASEGMELNATQRGWFADAASELAANPMVTPATLDTCHADLVQACARARARLEVPLPSAYAGRQLGFSALVTLARRRIRQ